MPPKKKQGETKTQPAILKKTVSRKGIPTAAMPVEFVNDKKVGSHLHFLVGGPGSIPNSETIIHRPIGKTDLVDDCDWVISSPEDVALLKSRASNPRQKVLSDSRDALMRKKAIDDKLIKIDASGAVRYLNNTVRATFLATVKADAIETNKGNKNFKYSADAALAKDESQNAEHERAYRLYMQAHTSVVEGEIPETYRTRGGPMADRTQDSLLWASGYTKEEIQYALFKHGITGPPVVELGNSTMGPIVLDSKEPNQWIFLPTGVTDEKKRIKPLLDKIQKSLKDFGHDNVKLKIEWDA